MQRGIVQPILIFVGLLLISLTIYYFYQNLNPKNVQENVQVAQQKRVIPNLTQTYTDSDLGVSFEYPKDLTVKSDTQEEFSKRGGGDFRKNFKSYVGYEPGKVLGVAVVLDKENNFDTNPFTVWVFDNSQALTIDAWYKNFWYYPFVWGDFTYTGKFTLAPKDEATVSGQMAKSGVIDYQPGKPKFIYVSKDKKMYLFRIISNLGDQILSTFKFLP